MKSHRNTAQTGPIINSRQSLVVPEPSTIFGGPLFTLGDGESWPDLARRIAKEHVHPSERRR